MTKEVFISSLKRNLKIRGQTSDIRRKKGIYCKGGTDKFNKIFLKFELGTRKSSVLGSEVRSINRYDDRVNRIVEGREASPTPGGWS